MSFTLEDVKKAAHLARLDIKPEEMPGYEEKLARVMQMIDHLSELDTDEIAPMIHPLDAVQRLREDMVTESNERELAQSIAPKVESFLYLVPQVIEGSE